MLKNYFKIAIRHLTRHKLFSVINILCLAIGITFSMTIGIYILNQEAVNSRLKNVENQYIIKSKWKTKDMGLDITTLGPLAKTLKTEYPTLVADYYRFNPEFTFQLILPLVTQVGKANYSKPFNFFPLIKF